MMACAVTDTEEASCFTLPPPELQGSSLTVYTLDNEAVAAVALEVDVPFSRNIYLLSNQGNVYLQSIKCAQIYANIS